MLAFICHFQSGYEVLKHLSLLNTSKTLYLGPQQCYLIYKNIRQLEVELRQLESLLIIFLEQSSQSACPGSFFWLNLRIFMRIPLRQLHYFCKLEILLCSLYNVFTCIQQQPQPNSTKPLST